MLKGMRAITIQQPYAHLIATPQRELPLRANVKRVENRTWSTDWRGPLAIHAGTSFEWFKYGDWPAFVQHCDDVPEMTFGGFVAVVNLVACVKLEDVQKGTAGHSWILDHKHTNGPVCWVFDNIRRIPKPVMYTGRQGLWSPPVDVVAAIAAQVAL